MITPASIAFVIALANAWWSARHTQNSSVSIAAASALIFTVGGAITNLMNSTSTLWGAKWFMVTGGVFLIGFIGAIVLVEIARNMSANGEGE